MTLDDRDARLETLFHQALDLDVDQRTAFVQQHCAADPGLADELSSLLSAHGCAPACLDDTGWAGALLGEVSEAAPGVTIGPYQILELLGEGGMGSVHRARQDHPLQREVALKLVKPGMDTREVLQRFESERRLLARLHHPNIAAVHDAGATPRGRPYFVMELVDGQPLTRWCDRHRSSLEQRLSLFATACAAVQHAHIKGVLHRDLKPGNVLVTEVDGVPVPKIIDFGVAKVFEGPGREGTLCTRQGQLIGTPGYMSPEQAAGDGARVDTRTDVYSLGVLLYELLSGELPHRRTALRGADDSELRRAMSSAVPLEPSARLAALSRPGRLRRARRRGLDPASLRRRLRGSLDWIVAKAIETDPARRYASASELAADVAAFLRHEPVSAGPPPLAFRVLRLASAHRLGSAAAALLLLAALSGPPIVALRQGVRLAALEQGLQRIDTPSSTEDLAAGGSAAPAPACADCASLSADAAPADLVLVRNAGRVALHAGDLLDLRGEGSHQGLAVFDVVPALQGSGMGLLGPLARGVEHQQQHLHAAPGALAPGQLGQAVSRGSLALLRVNGPVAALAPLGPSGTAGAAAQVGPRAARVGTAQVGWAGPGPGYVRALVSPVDGLPALVSPAADGGGVVGFPLDETSGGAKQAHGPQSLNELLAGGGSLPVPPTPDPGPVTPSKVPTQLEGAVLHASAPAVSVLKAQQPKGVAPLLAAADQALALRAGRTPGTLPVVDSGEMTGTDDEAEKDQADDDSGAPPTSLGAVEVGLNGLKLTWVDYDGDGFSDLSLVRDGQLSLLRNLDQGLFLDVTDRVGLKPGVVVHETFWAHLDGDDRPDLLVLTDDGKLLMLSAHLPGLLLDVTAGSGLAGLAAVTRVELLPAQADLPRDVLVASVSDTLLLLLNNGSGHFEVVLLQAQQESDLGSEGAPSKQPAGQGGGGFKG